MPAKTDSETKLKYETLTLEEELASAVTLASLWRLSLARHSLSTAERLELLELSPYINELLVGGQLLQRYFLKMLAEISVEMGEESPPPTFLSEGHGEAGGAPDGGKILESPLHILSSLNPKQTREIFSILSEELQTTVVLRIAEVEEVSPEMLQELDDAMKFGIGSTGRVQRCKVEGVEKVIDMLNHFDKSKKIQILEKLDGLSPHLAEVIRKRLFTFEEIFALDDRSIKAIMREISNDTLTIAMKASNIEVMNKIFKNLSSRAVEMIKEDLKVMGPVRLSDVERAQSTIAKIVLEMEQQGKICFSDHGREDVLV